jgi:hypothetical protein
MALALGAMQMWVWTASALGEVRVEVVRWERSEMVRMLSLSVDGLK